MTGSISLFECGVDYITLTATQRPYIQELYEHGLQVVRGEHEGGNKLVKWRSLGYIGLTAGSASVGQGNEGSIVRLSSEVAKGLWSTLYPMSTNCSRIDLQFTVRTERSSTEVLTKVWNAAIAESNTRQRPLKLKQTLSPGKPETITVGSRQSERFGRIYDKGVESGLECFAEAVRWEVEFKGSWSKRISATLASSNSEPNVCVSQVDSFFRKNGVSPELACGSSALSRYVLETNLVCPYSSASRGTVSASKARSLRWLEVSCKPVVQRLIASGHREELYRALGLLDQLQHVKSQRNT